MPVPSADHSQYVEHIATILENVPSLGKILRYPRDLQNLEDIDDAFTDGTPAIINAWVIQRERINTNRRGQPSRTEIRYNQYVVRGYYQLSDDLESETTFQGMVTDVMDAFVEGRLNATSSATAFFQDTEDVSIRTITSTILGGHWVHYCEVSLVFSERIQCIEYTGVDN